MKTVIVTIPGMIQESDLTPLKTVSEIELHEATQITQFQLAELCLDADYLMLNYDVVKKIDEEFYSHPNVQKLKSISVDLTGMEWANPQVARKYGVQLQNTPQYSTESVAESILAEVLLHARQIHTAYQDEIKGEKVQTRKAIDLKNRTAGVVGLGNIGTRVAELLSGIGMKVVGWNKTVRPMPNVTLVSLEELFQQSDVICLTLKTVKEGTASTVGIINKKLLQSAKPGMVLINLASRQLVDHDVLFQQMSAGRIGGYSITRNEEVQGLKVSELDTVHLAPDNAWFSDESMHRLREIWVENIVSAINGKPQNIVKE